jgi:hypothetical protein
LQREKDLGHMARERKRHAQDAVVPVAPPAGAMPPNDPIAKGPSSLDYQDQMLALVRAMARDAARADHEAECGSNRPQDRPA